MGVFVFCVLFVCLLQALIGFLLTTTHTIRRVMVLGFRLSKNISSPVFGSAYKDVDYVEVFSVVHKT